LREVDLEYYLFDWDDNILFMPTLIHLEHNGAEVSISTGEYAAHRKNDALKPVGGDWGTTFRSFRDPPVGDGDFVGDTRTAIASRKRGPSYEAFKRAITRGRLFAIVTARGHSAETIREGVEVFIEEAMSDAERQTMVANIQEFNRLAEFDIADDQCVARYLDLNSYVGVSSPNFLRSLEMDAPDTESVTLEDAKTYAVEKFVETTVRLRKNLKNTKVGSMSFGFSDDDKGNYAKMREFIKEDLAKRFLDADFFIYDTSGNRVRGERIR
jgi:hypothetical protein